MNVRPQYIVDIEQLNIKVIDISTPTIKINNTKNTDTLFKKDKEIE